MTEFPEPRIGTPRRADLRPDTTGHLTARWHLLVMRHHLLPWQRHVADVAGELDPDTGLRHYDAVLLKVPRQNGKTWWLRADMLANSRRPGPDGELGRRIVVYTAQDRGKAREQVVTELVEQQLDRCLALSGRYTARKSNGSERIVWRDTGARIQVEASNSTAGHGLTIDDAVLDEAFAHRDLTIINALEPTMLTKPDPQIKIVSTPGEGDDGLMLHYEELATVAVNDPDTTLAVFDWSASDDDDRADPAVWARVMPAFGHTIDEKRVRSLLNRTPAAEFDRAYLARRPAAATVAAISPGSWADCTNPGPPIVPAGPCTIAVELDPERTFGTIAVASRSGDQVAVIVDRQPGTRWIADTVLSIVHREGLTVLAVWADRRSGLGGVIDELAGRGVDVHEVSAGDVASAAGTLWDLVEDRAVVHDGQPAVNDAVIGSRRRPLGDAWTFAKLDSVHDVAPLAAIALAVAAHRQHVPAGPLGGIR